MTADNTAQTRPGTHPQPAEDELLLLAYGGEKPQAPDWFNEAIAVPSRMGSTTVDGARIAWQAWGDASKPGLLLAHGNGAHSHWWDFIAPMLAEDWHVVAPDFSGMGESDWRKTYSFRTFAREQVAVSEAAGLFADGRKPLIVAHSFGGIVALVTAMQHGARFAGALVVDSHIEPPGEDRPRPPSRQRPNRIYPNLAAALARFRLAPPQPCENHYIVDHIARHSLREATGEDGEHGLTWKFDPFIFANLSGEWDELDLTRLETGCPIAFMRGALSTLVTPATAAYMASLQDPPVPMITIPGAHHHVMLDQPLAFVSAVRALFAVWPGR